MSHTQHAYAPPRDNPASSSDDRMETDTVTAPSLDDSMETETVSTDSAPGASPEIFPTDSTPAGASRGVFVHSVPRS